MLQPLTGEECRTLRKQAGLNQTQLGELVGTSPGNTTVSDWERGVHRIQLGIGELIRIKCAEIIGEMTVDAQEKS